MAITRQMDKSLITGLTVVPKAKFNKIKWDESQDPRHAYYRLHRYESEEDADDNVNAEVFGPIVERFFKDDDDLPHGEEFWYRVVDVDQDDVEGDLSEPASLEARGVQSADVEPAAITPILLNAETVSVNGAHAIGPFALAANARNILVQTTLTFDASDAPTVNRRFTVSGIVGSANPLLSAVSRVFINVDTGTGWIFPVGIYPEHSDFLPPSHSLTCGCQSVYEILMAGSTTSITFGVDVYIAAGASGSLKNASIVVHHNATADA